MYKSNDGRSKGLNILVGMSGGVDSSTAALMLKEQGHKVIGVTMAIYRGKLNTTTSYKCGGACYSADEKEDIEAARNICNQIGIEYYVFDCVEKYNEIVLEKFKKEYLSGRTPNPCVWCNSLIKFDVLPRIAGLNGIEFDKFATGHYARIEEEDGRYILKRGKNPKKDQSYFLYRLKQEQLKNILLPLGDYTKEEIRKRAEKCGLAVADKPDSQDFYEGDYKELLGVDPKPGNIVDTDGKVLGEHQGIWNYTIGQRRGLEVGGTTDRLFVVGKNLQDNILYVALGEDNPYLYSDSCIIDTVNFNCEERPLECSAKFRYRANDYPVTLEYLDNGEIKVKYDAVKSVTPGQACVFYDGEKCLGGGIVKTVCKDDKKLWYIL